MSLREVLAWVAVAVIVLFLAALIYLVWFALTFEGA
jgi:hypothetical protein